MKHLRLAALALGLALGANTAAQAELRLKPRVVVVDSQITLGDLFDAAGAAATTSLGPAPEPGQKIALRVPAVLSFVQSHGLSWTPGPAVNIIMVERASQTIGTPAVMPLVERALRKAGLDGLYTVELRQRDFGVELPAGKPYDLSVASMNYDDRSGRFDATLSITAAGSQRQVAVSGQVTRRIEVPVLAKSIARGDTIGRNDIVWIEIARDDAGRDIAADADQLVGQQVRRSLQAERPVRLSDLQRPVLVEKKDLVTLTVASPNMTLTMTGLALEDGSLGDTVRLMNQKSKKTVQGVVIGPKEVRVPSGGALQLAKH